MVKVQKQKQKGEEILSIHEDEILNSGDKDMDSSLIQAATNERC